MIVDGYCDVCGSPAGAAPFGPAAVSAASPAPADEPGPTAVRGEPGFSPKPKSGSPITACTQPGCIGMIVDGYCDLCGSPAGAALFAPAAASAASPAPTDEPGPTAVPAPTPVPGPIDEEIPTQRIPPVIDVEGSREVEATPPRVSPRLPISRRATPPRLSPRLPISRGPTPRLPVHSMTTQ
jgi:hypothetical protein